MSERPVILSVIVPMYNAESTIRQALDSVLGQSLRDIEVICVDDGSKDGTVGIVREYMARDPRVSLITQQNRFAGAARNAGIDAAKGEYLFFLDADDYVLDYALEAVCAKAKKHRLDCLKFLAMTRDEKEERYVDKKRNNGGTLLPEDYDRLLKVEQGSPLLRVSVTPWSGIYRRAFVMEKNCRFNSLRCVNDRSFYTKVMTNADRIMVTRDRVTVHRENQDTSLVGKRAEHFDCQIASLQLTEAQLKADAVPQESMDAVMKQEFMDLAFWYRRFSVTPEREAEMGKQIRDYLDSGETDYGFLLQNRLDTPALPIRPAGEVRPFHEACEHPAVSVLVPAVNAEDTLDRALESLTNQTLEKMEFLLLYDGAEGLAGAILKEYAEVDKRFRILSLPGETYDGMMNAGLEQAKGDYIGILTPDDYAEKDMYERLLKEARRHRLDLARTDRIMFRINPDRTMDRQTVRLLENEALYYRTVNAAKEPGVFRTPAQTRSSLYRRSFLERNGIRWGAEEDVFWFLTLAFARRTRFLKEGLYNEARKAPEEQAADDGAEERTVEAFRMIRDRIGDNPALAGAAEACLFKKMLRLRGRLEGERRRAWTLRMRDELKGSGNAPDRSLLTKHEARRLDEILKDPENTADRIDLSVILPAGQEGTEACLKSLTARHDANIEIIRTEGESGAALNEGLRKARGAWCLFADAGSLYEADTLDRIWRRAEAEQPDVLAFPGDRFNPETGASSADRTAREDLLPEKRRFAGTEVKQNLFRALSGRTGDKLFRTAFLREKEIAFPAADGGAAVFVFTAAACAGTINRPERPVLVHRILRPDAPESWEEGAADGGVAAMAALRENLRNQGLYKRFERDYVNYALHFCLRQALSAAPEDSRRICAELKAGGLDAAGIVNGPGDYYYDAEEYALLRRIRALSPEDFLQETLKREAIRADLLSRPAPEEEDPRLKSVSYRIGRTVTWLPRKIRTANMLLREHGAAFVMDYGKEMLTGNRDETKN